METCEIRLWQNEDDGRWRFEVRGKTDANGLSSGIGTYGGYVHRAVAIDRMLNATRQIFDASEMGYRRYGRKYGGV